MSGNIPPELGSLTPLETLDLSSNELSGPVPPELGNLKGLKLLRFKYNRLGLELPTELLMLLDSRDEVEITPQRANNNVR